jgi:hypothetical protein
MLAVATATIALAGVLVNLAETRKANRLTHKRELTEQRAERYTAAITQLGADTLDIRLGGIYALERLARDSPKEQQPTVVEVLSAFVRTRSTDPALRDPPTNGPKPAVVRQAADLRAAVQVLARLPYRDKIPRADLAGADLTGPAGLDRLTLTEADLRKVDLRHAHANLTDARLEWANLTAPPRTNPATRSARSTPDTPPSPGSTPAHN